MCFSGSFWTHSCSFCRTLVEEMVAVASGTAGGDDGGAAGRPLTKAQPGHRSYNLQERRRIGSMTGVEQALLPRVPTDESEAQTLATADLDLMKSECLLGPIISLIVGGTKGKKRRKLILVLYALPGHRFEDVPGVRRHLVRKNAKGSTQTTREGREPGPTPRARPRAPHKPHEVHLSISCLPSPPLYQADRLVTWCPRAVSVIGKAAHCVLRAV